MVIIHHVEQLKSIFGYKSYWGNLTILLIGKLGVILFFVLSGFLITYLLLIEEKVTNTISVSNFYKRRILRIWPLYYFLVTISFLLLNHLKVLYIPGLSEVVYSNLAPKLLLFIFFVPNIALFIFAPVPYISQTWSVGVEEQFYLLWPWLMKKFKQKQAVLFMVIAIYLSVKFSNVFFIRTGHWDKRFALFYSFWDNLNIDCMAIGGLMAYWLFAKSYLLKYLFDKYLQLLVLLSTVVLIFNGIVIPRINYEVYGLLFSILILNLAANKNCIISLENKELNYLGKISYGIYMYHPIAIILCLQAFGYLGWHYSILEYSISLLITLFISILSYEFFEKKFVKMKLKFSTIESGEPI